MPVLAHPGIFETKLRFQPFLRFIGPPFSLCQAESAGPVMLLSRGPTVLAPGLTATGEVERISGFEDVKFWTIRDGCHVRDCIPDDQSIIAEIEGRGLAITAVHTDEGGGAEKASGSGWCRMGCCAEHAGERGASEGRVQGQEVLQRKAVMQWTCITKDEVFITG